MYGVPSDLPLGLFVNALLERVCFGPYIAHFHFSTHQPQQLSAGIRISIEGNCELINEADEVIGAHIDTTRPFGADPIARNLLLLVGGIVTGYEINAPSHFTLHLNSMNSEVKYKFRIYDSSKKYESFQIVLPDGGQIIV